MMRYLTKIDITKIMKIGKRINKWLMNYRNYNLYPRRLIFPAEISWTLADRIIPWND